ncbi:MAG: hypothetical protein IPL65_10855 [Lewinellaceae bacterium]|nr:hypothetical protein [Lewinellaceae bacterium]
MTEQQDFQSLDELFRSTFNNLPDSPSPAGWDQPSDKVWTQVEKAIPAKTGWTPAQTLASGLVVVAIALTAYWLLRPVSDVRQDQPLPSQEIPAPAPAQEASPLSPATAEVPVAQPKCSKTGSCACQPQISLVATTSGSGTNNRSGTTYSRSSAVARHQPNGIAQHHGITQAGNLEPSGTLHPHRPGKQLNKQ